MIKKLTGLTASLVALASTASANVKINDYLSVEGYAVASLTANDTSGADETAFDSGRNNFDSINVALLGTYGALSGKVSLEYVPSDSDSVAEILDIYASYNVGSLTVTGGKFLSYLGYEAYHPIAMTQLTYGSTIGGIPGYHTGVKADFAISETFSIGASVTDSLFPEDTTIGHKGDGEFDDGLGYEFIATFTGIEKLTVFTGVGIEDDDVTGTAWVADVWAAYALSDKVTLGAEYVYFDDVSNSYLATLQYHFTEKFSLLSRWSAIDPDAGSMGTFLTLAPTYVFTDNFSIRGEVSYSDSVAGDVTGVIGGKGYFYGVQGVFKF